MAPVSGVIKSNASASPILPLEMWIKLGMGPRKSSSVCILTAALVLRKSAQKQSETQIYRSAVECIDCVVKIKPDIVIGIKIAGSTDQDRCKIMPNAPIAQFVSIGQSRPRNGIAKSHTVEFGGLRAQTCFNVT